MTGEIPPPHPSCEERNAHFFRAAALLARCLSLHCIILLLESLYIELK